MALFQRRRGAAPPSARPPHPAGPGGRRRSAGRQGRRPDDLPLRSLFLGGLRRPVVLSGLRRHRSPRPYPAFAALVPPGVNLRPADPRTRHGKAGASAPMLRRHRAAHRLRCRLRRAARPSRLPPAPGGRQGCTALPSLGRSAQHPDGAPRAPAERVADGRTAPAGQACSGRRGGAALAPSRQAQESRAVRRHRRLWHAL
jgi:hypothetical protein